MVSAVCVCCEPTFMPF